MGPCQAWDMPFSKDTAAAAGRMGGMRRTAAKQEAARRNGRKNLPEEKPAKKEPAANRPPKDYVIAVRQPSREEVQMWEEGHPHMPCPPHRFKQYFRDLPLFKFIAMHFKENPTMTAHDIEEWGGGKYGGKGEAILRYLRSL
jgi:hypothetical protein